MAVHRLSASAPYVPVTLRNNGQERDCVALIDTGATMTAVSPEMIKALKPTVIGSIEVAGVGQLFGEASTDFLSIMIDRARPWVGVEVVAVAPSSPCQVLIGRDLMSRWIMAWDGPGDRLVISY